MHSLQDLSVDEEYKIINSKVEEDPELQIINENRKHAQQTSGNAFYRSSKELYRHPSLHCKALGAGDSNLLSSLVSAMVFLSPVFNFLENMAHRVQENMHKTPVVAKLWDVARYFSDEDGRQFPLQRWDRLDVSVSPLFGNIFYLFEELLKLLHNDLTRRYKFVEDTWEESSSRVRTKSLYAGFSPIVDIFHIKVRHQSDKSSRGRVECLCSLEVDCAKHGVAECLSQMDGRGGAEKDRSTVTKCPHVLTVKLLNAGATSVPEDVFVSSKKYAIRTLVCTTGSKYVVCVKDKGGYTQLGSSVTKLNGSDIPTPLLAFYIATNYDFD
ncbi:UNVERIFIED_CONTAM: hypothetical protein PYX00_010905 [Menopon gallinae]|uniref:Uncharacterized protein n=1 Tax=Menopon gallinae TaxID=328185 RepID=A0AAW2H6C3_9NEOP